ncbi:hypothetical protein HY990_05300 [Candidatus Micrarchaeota archaeon]|nr:hypothetical protein [Candidatus Micrarchaeota archaeon]
MTTPITVTLENRNRSTILGCHRSSLRPSSRAESAVEGRLVLTAEEYRVLHENRMPDAPPVISAATVSVQKPVEPVTEGRRGAPRARGSRTERAEVQLQRDMAAISPFADREDAIEERAKRAVEKARELRIDPLEYVLDVYRAATYVESNLGGGRAVYDERFEPQIKDNETRLVIAHPDSPEVSEHITAGKILANPDRRKTVKFKSLESQGIMLVHGIEETVLAVAVLRRIARNEGIERDVNLALFWEDADPEGRLQSYYPAISIIDREENNGSHRLEGTPLVRGLEAMPPAIEVLSDAATFGMLSFVRALSIARKLEGIADDERKSRLAGALVDGTSVWDQCPLAGEVKVALREALTVKQPNFGFGGGFGAD